MGKKAFIEAFISGLKQCAVFSFERNTLNILEVKKYDEKCWRHCCETALHVYIYIYYIAI